MVGEKSPPPLSPSASRLHGAGPEISPLHSSSPAKKGDSGAGIPPLQSSPPAKEGGILGDQPPAGKVCGTRDGVDCRWNMDKKESSDALGEAQVTSETPLLRPRPSPPLEQQKSGEIHGEQPAAGEVIGQRHASGEIRVLEHALGKTRAVAASSTAEKAQSGKVNGDKRGGSVVRRKKRDKRDSSEVCVEQQVTVEARVEQQVTSGVPSSLPSSKKRQILENSGSLRPKKVAKVTNDKVVLKQLQNKSKTVQRLLSPIVSGSPMINMMARKRAQSHASSPNPHAKSPKTRRTMKSPSLHDLSPAAPTIGTPASIHDLSPAASNGSKRKPRKLTSIVWKHAEPIYIDGVLMQGRCKYCNIVFPASKVSGAEAKICEGPSKTFKGECSPEGVKRLICMGTCINEHFAGGDCTVAGTCYCTNGCRNGEKTHRKARI